MKLKEQNPNLFHLIERCLMGDYVSPAADPADESLRVAMLRSLATLEVGEPCRCGDTFCQTFTSANAASSAGGYHRVRFVVQGELFVECDDDGVISRVDRLLDEGSEVAHYYVYTPDGWVERPIASSEDS